MGREIGKLTESTLREVDQDPSIGYLIAVLSTATLQSPAGLIDNEL